MTLAPIIRAFNMNDAAAAKTLYLRSWSELCTRLGIDVTTVDTSDWVVTADWVAVGDSGKLLGFVLLKDNLIDRLYVDVDEQRAGVGKLLMVKAMAEGGNHLWVDEGSSRGRAFYESLGFTWSGVTKSGYNFPQFTMLEYRLDSV